MKQLVTMMELMQDKEIQTKNFGLDIGLELLKFAALSDSIVTLI